MSQVDVAGNTRGCCVSVGKSRGPTVSGKYLAGCSGVGCCEGILLQAGKRVVSQLILEPARKLAGRAEPGGQRHWNTDRASDSWPRCSRAV